MKNFSIKIKQLFLISSFFASLNVLAEDCGSSYQNIANMAIQAYEQTLAVTATHADDNQYVKDNNGPALQSNLEALHNAQTLEECNNAAGMLVLYAHQMRGNSKSYHDKYNAAPVESSTSTTSSTATAYTE
jgi:hypothetical protein